MMNSDREKGKTGSSILDGSSFTTPFGMTVTVSKLLAASQVIAEKSRSGPANHIIVGVDVHEEIEEHFGSGGVRDYIKLLGEDPKIVIKTIFGKDPSVKEMRNEFSGLMDKKKLAEKLVEVYRDPNQRGRHLGKKSGIL